MPLLSTRFGTLLATGLLLGAPALAQQPGVPLGLVPLPREAQTNAGTYALLQRISVYATGPAAHNVAELLKGFLAPLGKTAGAYPTLAFAFAAR